MRLDRIPEGLSEAAVSSYAYRSRFGSVLEVANSMKRDGEMFPFTKYNIRMLKMHQFHDRPTGNLPREGRTNNINISNLIKLKSKNKEPQGAQAQCVYEGPWKNSARNRSANQISHHTTIQAMK